MSTEGTTRTAPNVAYILEPRFPGGTSSAVAAELDVVCDQARVRLFGLDTGMFSGRDIAPQISAVLRRQHLTLEKAQGEIAADLVILHNPSCLKFLKTLNIRIVARHLIVVTHENFLRPGGALAFDVDKCLSLLRDHSITLKRSLAPISGWNRSTVQAWLTDSGVASEWSIYEKDWFNICAFDIVAPNAAPTNRRGRHSRPGLEKFPARDVMEMSFPDTAEANVILGGDSFLQTEDVPPHWTVHPFGGMPVERFFTQIDFMVYYTAPTWRESFGRVIAEAIAAGKIVLTDAETAETFGGAAVSANPEMVDSIIDGYIAKPEKYVSDVEDAQATLARFSPDAFAAHFQVVIQSVPGEAA